MATPDASALVIELLKRDRDTSLWSISVTETVPSALYLDGVAVSPAPPDLVLRYHGLLLTSSGDHLARLIVEGDNLWVVEEIRRGSVALRRFGDRGWASTNGARRLPDLLQSIEQLEQAGSVDRNGRPLARYRAELNEPLQLSTMWRVDEPTGEQDTGTLEILTDPSGLPQALVIDITSDDLAIRIPELPAQPPRIYRVELDRQPLPVGVSIPDLSQPLSPMRIEEHNLTIGLPAGWKREVVEDGMVWLQDTKRWAYVGIKRVAIPPGSSEATSTQQLDEWSRSWIRNASEAVGVNPIAIESAQAGPVAAYLSTYHVPDRPDQAAFIRIDATFVHDGWAYLARWESGGDFDLVDRYTFEQILESLLLRRG